MLIPLKETSSRSVARALVHRWISVFGAPYQIHSDRGSNVDSKLIGELCSMLGIRKSRSTPYHPNSDGLVERLFRTTKEMLRCCLDGDYESNWPDMLPIIEMGLRSSLHATTEISPYEVLFAKPMRTHLDWIEGNVWEENQRKFSSENDYIVWLEKQFQTIHKKVTGKIIKAAERMKTKYKNVSRKFKIGDYVMVKVLDKDKKCFENRYHGPYKIVKLLGDYSYRMVDRKGAPIDRHRTHLKLCHEPNIELCSAESECPEQSRSSSCARPKRKRYPPEKYGFS